MSDIASKYTLTEDRAIGVFEFSPKADNIKFFSCLQFNTVRNALYTLINISVLGNGLSWLSACYLK